MGHQVLDWRERENEKHNGIENSVLTGNFPNGLELHVGDGIVEGAAGLPQVVRVDVAHPDMSRRDLLG